MLALVDEKGQIVVGYLGTNAAKLNVASKNSRPIDYEEEEKEMAVLQMQVKKLSGKGTLPISLLKLIRFRKSSTNDGTCYSHFLQAQRVPG